MSSTTVSNPYSFNISKNTEFSCSNIVKASTFECEFKITACEEFVLDSNDYGQTKMSGYYKDFSYLDIPEYVFDLGSVDIINISNGCSLRACYATRNLYAGTVNYKVQIIISAPNIDGKDTSLSMKTYIMDSNNNIREAETLIFERYVSSTGIVSFALSNENMFSLYNIIVASYKNPNRYIKLYIE